MSINLNARKMGMGTGTTLVSVQVIDHEWMKIPLDEPLMKPIGTINHIHMQTQTRTIQPGAFEDMFTHL
jgi:hypothetical protein